MAEETIVREDDDMVKKAVYLGRTLEWSENGLCVRPDRRHVRSLLRELGMENCRSILPWKRKQIEVIVLRCVLNSPRNIALLLHGLCVAAVELAKTMAIPRVGDDERNKRVARHLHGHPDYLQWFPFQEDTDTVVLTTDADRGTCKESRRSHSGGALQLGNLIAAWSRVQPRIALSSGEAKLYAGMRGISETLGFVHLMREFKSNDWGRIVHRVDASACRASMLRRGCGGFKRITVESLWVHEPVRENSIAVERVPRDVMHAHVLACPSSAEELRNSTQCGRVEKHLTELNAYRDGEVED